MEKIVASGRNGTVEFDGRGLRFTRNSATGRLFVGGGEKLVPLSAVGSVQLKRPTALTKGWWQVSILGEVQRSTRGPNYADENGVVIVKKDLPAFEVLTAAVNEALLER